MISKTSHHEITGVQFGFSETTRGFLNLFFSTKMMLFSDHCFYFSCVMIAADSRVVHRFRCSRSWVLLVHGLSLQGPDSQSLFHLCSLLCFESAITLIFNMFAEDVDYLLPLWLMGLDLDYPWLQPSSPLQELAPEFSAKSWGGPSGAQWIRSTCACGQDGPSQCWAGDGHVFKVWVVSSQMQKEKFSQLWPLTRYK